MREAECREGETNANGMSVSGLRSACGVLVFAVLFLIFQSLSCEGFQVGKVEIHGLHSIDEEEFLDIFGIREGTEVIREDIGNAIKRVFLKGLFDDIAVTVGEGDNPDVIITVREREFIKKVRIYLEDGDDLSKKNVKEQFLLKEDQVLRYDLGQRAVSELKEYLSLYGYPQADVNVNIEDTSEPHRVILSLFIRSGPPLIVNKIIIAGAPSDTVRAMKLSEGDIYNQHVLIRDLERIKTYYKKQGYVSPSAEAYPYADGVVEIEVDLGIKLRIRLEGNHVISTKKLMREIPFFEIETFNDEVIEETIDRMLSRYYREGYPFTQIAPVKKSEDGESEITFFIFEGEQNKVQSIEFKGASIPHESLKKVMSLKEGGIYNPELMDRDSQFIKEFYGALGYLEAQVKEIAVHPDKLTNTVLLDVHIEEGERTEIVSVDVGGVDLDVGLNPGDPYNEVDIADARFRIIDFYKAHGYTNVDVSVQRNIQNRRASIVFDVSEGDKKVFGKTIIVGNKKTKYEVIRRELLHTEGEPYSDTILAQERQRLYKLGLFADIDIEPIDVAEDTRDILIKVQEANAGAVEFGFGYARYEEFRGFVEIRYGNLWGMNRLGSVRTELSSLEERYILQYREPWFLGMELPLRLFFLYEDIEEINIDDGDTRYRVERYTFTGGIEKKVSRSMKTEFYYEFSHVRTSDVQPDVVLSKEDVGTLAISSVRPAIVYDTRDNPFEPQKGILAGISLKLAPDILFSESNFVKVSASGSIYKKVHRRIILAASVGGGFAYGFDDTDELPLVERFFLGGRTTVRGFEQDTLGPKGEDGNPTGGNAFLMSNIELRTSLTKSIGLVTFIDMGNVWIDTNDVDPLDLRYTSGIGLRYNTPVGPLRVDYGVKLDREPDESRGEVHFSIGHAF